MMVDRRLEVELAALRGGPVAGVDEVGRGPLAGPVVAAAVILPAAPAIAGLDDSKVLAAARREELAREIHRYGVVAIAEASVEEIDRLNIYHAALLAMRRAVAALALRPAAILVDGNRLPDGLDLPAEAVVGGDGLCAAVAAASIVAKVYRDRLMAEWSVRYPGYGFENHAGYATPAHKAALMALGPTPLHRRSFRPIRDMFT